MDLHLLHATHHQLDLDDVGVFKCAHRLAPRIAAGRGIRGVLVLATCNRFELYLDAAADDGVAAHALGVVADAAQRSVAEIAGLLVPVRGHEVVHHLFRVSSGLASAVVGEQEIRGQVRRALEQARAQQTLSPALQQLGTASLEAARDVARRTRLTEAGRSSVGVALDLAEGLGVTWDAARVVLAGTGSYAGTSLAQLRARGCEAIAVHSASGRADGFAERHGVEALPAGGMGNALVDADAVVVGLDADWSEQANQLEDVDTAEGLEQVRLAEAKEIRAALQRIDDGSYGICANCGVEIAPARLQALPTATLCISCAP